MSVSMASFFRTRTTESTMARHLAVDKKQRISHLHDSGMSNRQIAKALGINRKSVDKHVAEVIAKRANDVKRN